MPESDYAVPANQGAPFNLELRSDCGVTYVNGGNPNVFGHALFRFGMDVGYMHVDHIYDYPRYIKSDKFSVYLEQNGKHVMYNTNVYIPNHSGALDKVRELADKKWLWLAVPHNCVTFCETIVVAGGGDWGSYTNLPRASAAGDSFVDSLNSLKRYIMASRYGGR